MKKAILSCLAIIFSCYIYAQTDKGPDFHQWALTPPMGWTSWDCYGPAVVESEVKANVDYMATHLKEYGWEYIVVDIRWFVENQTGFYYNQTNPIYCIDEYGRYVPATNRFPSSAGGAGFKPLADYIHGKGLKFGIHIMRGIPKEAVQKKLPIKGTTGITAADIYSTNLQCTWLKDNYTILANKSGAQEYYNSIFELYASWEVDFIKIDDLSRPYHQEEIELIRNAIDKTGRPIVLSMSPGETPVDKAEHARGHANMWRTVDDFWDNWDQLAYQFEVCNKWAPYIYPGAWPDADMLPLGRIDLRNNSRMTKFTQPEQYSLMSLFTIFKSPLMFGGNLPNNDAFTNSLLTNEEVLYMHKNSYNNKQWYNQNEVIAWTADDADSKDKFLALFFTGDNGFIRPEKALYRSGLISRLTDNYGVDIEISLPENTKNLYLIVSDGGDNFDNDHADWISPVVYNESGDTLRLTDLNWESASSGWGTVTKNKSISGNSLRILNKTFTTGIGTHSQSVIHYIIPEGYTGFKTFAGLDQGGTDQTGGATVEFFVFNTDPTLRKVNPDRAIANSGKISRNIQREGVNLEADITDAKKLYLVVTDAGDNFNYDHGDWINPTISKPDGTNTLLTSLSWVQTTSGYGSVMKNKSLDGNALKVNGTTYTNGIGVNAYSIIEYNLPAGYTKFTALCGFDDEVLSAPNGVTIEFMVFTEDPSVNNEVRTVPVDLTALGFEGPVKVRDMWKKKDLGTFSGNEFATDIPYHGAGLYRLSPEEGSSIEKTDKQQKQTVSVIQIGNSHYLKNVIPGSEILIYNPEGKLLSRFNAFSDTVLLQQKGLLIINVKSKGEKDVSILKTLI